MVHREAESSEFLMMTSVLGGELGGAAAEKQQRGSRSVGGVKGEGWRVVHGNAWRCGGEKNIEVER